jgi:23S rRNA (uridine2552-2'-O)-methyltransferase
MRVKDAKRDHYRKLAKNEGYRSRSAYKLLQLNRSYHFLKLGAKVIDLGCYPGGWLQVARREVGHHGAVVGIDLKEIDPLEGVVFINKSVQDRSLPSQIIGSIGSKADVLLSDLSPNVSGLWEVDHIRQINLSRAALQVAIRVLKNGGVAIFKVFEGQTLTQYVNEVKYFFSRARLGKPPASRQVSSELYLVCMNFERETPCDIDNELN